MAYRSFVICTPFVFVVSNFALLKNREFLISEMFISDKARVYFAKLKSNGTLFINKIRHIAQKKL